MPIKEKFLTTSNKTKNFGNQINFKATIDNWLNQNHVYNKY